MQYYSPPYFGLGSVGGRGLRGCLRLHLLPDYILNSIAPRIPPGQAIGLFSCGSGVLEGSRGVVWEALEGSWGVLGGVLGDP